MKVLVSGGTGLVGRYVVDGLIGAGHDVVVGGRRKVPSPPSPQGGELNPAALPDFNSTEMVRRVFSPLVGEMAGRPEGDFPQALCFTPLALDTALDQRAQFGGIDAFIHLAFDHLPGRYRGGEGNDPARFRHLNHEGSVKLFEDAKAAGVKRCIFLSSRAVYDGLPAGSVLTEDMDLSPDSLYGRIKLESEHALAALSSTNFITISLRATGVYGHHRPNKWDAMFENYHAGKPVTPRAGSEVHGDDLAAAMLLLLKADANVINGKAFNISDIVTDTREILSLYTQASGVSHPLPPPAGRESVSVMDTKQLTSLGWQPGGHQRLVTTLNNLARDPS